MSARVELLRIEFHNAGGATINYRGEDGYSLPADRPATTATFQVNDRNGTHSQFTVVLLGRFASYDAMIEAAWTKLAERLEGYASTGQELREAEAKRKEAKAAQSAA